MLPANLARAGIAFLTSLDSETSTCFVVWGLGYVRILVMRRVL